MTSSSTSSSRAPTEQYPADLAERSYPTTASERVHARTATMSAHAGVTNWVPPPHIIFPPSLNQMSSASHLPAATGTLDRDRVLVSNPRKRSVEDAGIDDFDNVDSDFEDEDDDADVLALDQGHEAILEIDGEEIVDNLPRKSLPKARTRTKNGSRSMRVLGTKRPAQRRRLSYGSPDIAQFESSASTAPATSSSPARKSAKPALILHFFREVDRPADRTHVRVGEKFYQCCHCDVHGESRTLNVTKGMKYNYKHLVSHLEHQVPAVWPLYQYFCERHERNVSPSAFDLEIASGKRSLANPEVIEYFEKLVGHTDLPQLKEGFNWEHWVKLLVKYIVVSNLPFSEVDVPEFVDLIQYTYQGDEPLKIPSTWQVCQQVIDMSVETINELRELFKEHKAKLSLILDAWTSSNGYAFLAIVVRFINQDFELEEVLIDFREIIGEHSGVHLADIVMEVLKLYGIENKVIAIMSDNATNNDTMMQSLEVRLKALDIPFVASHARLRCLAHIIDLAAQKILTSLDLVSEADLARTPSNYQDTFNSVVAALSNAEMDGLDEDDLAILQRSIEIVAERSPSVQLTGVASALHRLRTIIKAVRSSPQQRQVWFAELRGALDASQAASGSESSQVSSVPSPEGKPKILLLDVRTRWSSTHIMLERALLYRYAIDHYATFHGLSSEALSSEDWGMVEIVAGWLKLFRDTTTRMSARDKTTISSVYAVFLGLQDSVRQHIKSASAGISARLKAGLIGAHEKLAEYLKKSDISPFYMWAAFLDPRVTFHGTLRAARGADDLREDVLKSKLDFERYFLARYSDEPSTTSSAEPTEQDAAYEILDLFAENADEPSAPQQELERFFALRPEKYGTSPDPVKWWASHQSTFPRLARMARDILSIPGSAVSVERVFSGGRDTISLRRASLKPQTIRALMIVKHSLLLARARRARERRLK